MVKKTKFRLFFLFLFIFQTTIINSQKVEYEKSRVIVEMEQLLLNGNWKVDSLISGYSGTGYIFWEGDQHFQQTTYGVIEFQIAIKKPGIYQIIWHSRVGKDTINTEHNDTWLKISDDSLLFARNDSGHTLRPGGICTFDCPKGSSLNGFFKVYGCRHDQWEWKAYTSDHDPHQIFAKFDQAGTYTIVMAARSSYHLIDKIMLFNTLDLSLEQAIQLD